MSKQCSLCKKTLPLTEFNKNCHRKDGLQQKCRVCGKQHGKAYYQKNSNHIRLQIKVPRKNRKRKLQQAMFDYLLKHPCIECGEPDPSVLDFDHQAQTEKVANVSSLLHQGWSWTRILTEIAKCEVRCANCHRRKTAKDQQWYTERLKANP